jgi:hypothetical protein
MALVGKNNEPLYGRAIFAFNGTEYEVIQSDSDGNILVASKGGDKLFGFESIVLDRKSDLNATAGNNTLTSDAVPTGKVWVITNCNVLNSNTAMTRVTIYVSSGSNALTLLQNFAPVAGAFDLWSGSVLIPAAGTIVGSFIGCNLNDDIYLDYHGYQMDAP